MTKENANPRTGLNVGHHTGNARHFLIITLFPLAPIVMPKQQPCRVESMVENGRYWNATYDRAGETRRRGSFVSRYRGNEWDWLLGKIAL